MTPATQITLALQLMRFAELSEFRSTFPTSHFKITTHTALHVGIIHHLEGLRDFTLRFCAALIFFRFGSSECLTLCFSPATTAHALRCMGHRECGGKRDSSSQLSCCENARPALSTSSLLKLSPFKFQPRLRRIDWMPSAMLTRRRSVRWPVLPFKDFRCIEQNHATTFRPLTGDVYVGLRMICRYPRR